jgi:hypothetical protein
LILAQAHEARDLFGLLRLPPDDLVPAIADRFLHQPEHLAIA